MTSPEPRYEEHKLCATLDAAGIEYSYHQHKAVFTVAESQSARDTFPEGVSTKNLFLKDRRNNFFLLSLEENRQVSLKDLGKVIGARGSLSFANEELLWQHLGVTAGSVTPYAILNAGRGLIRQFIDEEIYQSAYFHAHPLRNDRTITARAKHVFFWLDQQGYPIERLDFSVQPPQILAMDTSRG